MATGVGVVFISIVSMFITWLLFGRGKIDSRMERFLYWLKSTAVTTVALVVWFHFKEPGLNIFYSMVLAFFCGGVLNFFRSNVGLMIP